MSKAHGIKGEIFVRPLNAYPDWPHPIDEIVIGDSTFSVQRYSRHKEGIIFKLDQCQTRSLASSFKAQPVFLPKKFFESKKGRRIYLAELISFCVEVLGHGEIGNIQSFQSHKLQDFLLVQQNDKEDPILIPFVPAYIKDIHFSKKRLILDLPENFLKIFT